MKTIIGIIIAIVVVGGGVYYYDRHRASTEVSGIDSGSSSSAQAGDTAANPAVGVGAQTGLPDIIVDNPRIADTVSSPLSISGQARGSWFFEGSAPVSLVDASGTPVASGVITAQGDWMTTNFVPFSGTLSWAKHSSTTAGYLKFQNDNPSGDAANAKRIDVHVYFQ